MESETIMKHLADQLKRRKMPRLWPYHLLLTRHVNAHMTLAGYLWLAMLLREGYFSTVVTVNPEPVLEEMLELLGIKRSAYRILVVGRDEDVRVADVLQGSPSDISIVKLHEDISSEGSAVLPVLSREVLISLQYYLCHDIVIIGSLEHDPLLTSILYSISTLSPVYTTDSIYYVVPEQSGATDPLLVIKTLSDQSRTPFIISGNYGTFEGFFSRLANILQVVPEPQLVASGTFQLPAALPYREAVTANAPAHIRPGEKNMMVSSGKKSVSADILLVTITDTEAEAVLTYAPHTYISMTIGRRTYYDLGTIGSNRTFMVRATSQGALEAFSTVKDGIEALTPRAVIMVGIAFGYAKGKQQIGDIMVATQIRDYDLKRVSSTPTHEQIVHPRGPRVPTSQLLLDRFINSPYTIDSSWPDAPAIHAGLILSGSSLVDHREYRDQLRQAAPDAIGGEMEGAGLLKAAMEAEQKVDWILIKAISDWADGAKNAYGIESQRKAAGNAARFTFHVIQQPDFLNRK